MTSNSSAASLTQRAIGPAVSCESEYGINPLRLTSPVVGRIPTKLFAEAGERTELTVSVPIPATPNPAATPAPVPPLDPPGVRLRSYGFSVCPPSELTVSPQTANSCRLTLAKIIAPASLSFRTRKASCAGCCSFRQTAPAVVFMSAVSILSLSKMGIPCNGPIIPCRRSVSSRSVAN